jgi:hypothetical protein
MVNNKKLKFKAYDKHTKKPVSDSMCYYMSFDNDGTVNVMNNIIVCQFTGRLDDNAKEIFEDDIVMDIVGKYYSVQWNDDTCKFQLSDGTDINDGDRYSTYLVVVGNIYENSNLEVVA